MGLNDDIPSIPGIPGVPTFGTGDRVKGSGDLHLNGQPRGVRNGVPYGEQLENEHQDLVRRYRFMPGAAAALKRATKAALGR